MTITPAFIRDMAILGDAMSIATRRCATAAQSAHEVDALIEQQLMTIHFKLAASTDAIGELLEELNQESSGE